MRKYAYLFVTFTILLSSYAEAGTLYDAVLKGDSNIEAVYMLLDRGANVNETGKYGKTPLHIAAENGYNGIAFALISAGANINARDEKGCTPLHWAGMYGDTEHPVAKPEGKIFVAKQLLEKGSDVNARCVGVTPLHAAARFGHANIVRLLLEWGADPTIKSDGGYTPLMIAEYYRKPTTIAILKELEDRRLREEEDKRRRIEEQARKEAEDKRRAEEQARLLKESIKEAIKEASPASKSETKKLVVADIHNIPDFKSIPQPNDLAVIIGIENYQGLPKSDFSRNDANIMKDYLKALGFQPRNIEFLINEKATKSSIERSLEAWLKNKAKPDSRIFVYYSGHGAPEPKTGDAYLVPYDGDPNYLEVTGYSLKRLYDNLGKLQVKEVTVVLDSCFSGAGGRSVLAQGARPLVMMTTSTVLPSNIAILSATQGTQISTSSTEKGHGVFTYYFLKALKEGKKTIAEIYEYIKPLVEDEAKQLNVQQSPSVSPDAEKLKGRFILRK
jgi:hypothetical protein